MPSQRHATLVELFRQRPSLAAELLREALDVRVPAYSDARVESADLTDIQPTEYRADLVVLLSGDTPVLGIVVEIQLGRDTRKPYVWPVYATTLRARFECPVRLLVVALTTSVAKWAAKPIDLDGTNVYTPLVLDRSVVPVILDESQARADPELAVLSALAHGQDNDTQKSARIALNAQRGCGRMRADRRQLFTDLILSGLSIAAQKELRKMDLATYEYQSTFARRCVRRGMVKGLAEGEAKGRVEGRCDLLIRQLTLRFGSLSESQQLRIRQASIAELDSIAERVLTASTLRQALGVKARRARIRIAQRN
jgi:hypothetical protein